MQINLFYYAIANLLFLQLLSLEINEVYEFLVILCCLGIATLGIAHGAIDDQLAGNSRGKKRLIFVFKYLAVFCFFALIWLMSSDIALIIFFITSSFHFGQTQLVNLHIKSKVISWICYFSWGSFIISLLIYFNSSAFTEIDGYFYLLPNSFIYFTQYASEFLITSLALLIVSFMILFFLKNMNINDLFREFYLLFLIALSFYLIAPFIAFSLFFIIVHSLKAIRQEYYYCKKMKIISNFNSFTKLFLPFTLCSLVILLVVILAIYYFGNTRILPYVLLVFLSSITFPHAFVMDRFYVLNRKFLDS